MVRAEGGAVLPVLVRRHNVLPDEHPEPVAVVVVAPVLDLGMLPDQVVPRRLEELNVVHLTSGGGEDKHRKRCEAAEKSTWFFSVAAALACAAS